MSAQSVLRWPQAVQNCNAPVLDLQAEPTVLNDELDEEDSGREEDLDVDEEFKRYSSASQSLSSIFTGEEEVLKVDPTQADESLLVSWRPRCARRATSTASLLVHSSTWPSSADAVPGVAPMVAHVLLGNCQPDPHQLLHCGDECSCWT